MREGWLGDDYLILFEEFEVQLASDRYAVSNSLPDFQIIGLRSWDDFILRASTGALHLIPTIPLEPRHISPFHMPDEPLVLRSDERVKGKIKWYVKPIVFGGSPQLGENVTWVDHEQHGNLVRWWNDKYRSFKAEQRH